MVTPRWRVSHHARLLVLNSNCRGGTAAAVPIFNFALKDFLIQRSVIFWLHMKPLGNNGLSIETPRQVRLSFPSRPFGARGPLTEFFRFF